MHWVQQERQEYIRGGSCSLLALVPQGSTTQAQRLWDTLLWTGRWAITGLLVPTLREALKAWWVVISWSSRRIPPKNFCMPEAQTSLLLLNPCYRTWWVTNWFHLSRSPTNQSPVRLPHQPELRQRQSIVNQPANGHLNGRPSDPFDQEECYARCTVAATRAQSLDGYYFSIGHGRHDGNDASPRSQSETYSPSPSWSHDFDASELARDVTQGTVRCGSGIMGYLPSILLVRANPSTPGFNL